MAQQPEPTVLKLDDVLALIQANNETMQKAFLEGIKELKKPSEREQAELDQKDRIFQAKRKERLQVGAAQEQQKLMRILSCNHSRPDGQHTWTGQVLSNNTFVPTCSQCWAQLPQIPVTVAQIRDGVNLNSYKGLNRQSLIEWHKKSYKGNCGKDECIGCHPEKLQKMEESLREQALKAQQLANQVAV